MTFVVGDRVICVNDVFDVLPYKTNCPVAGEIYTVRSLVAGGRCLLLKEIKNTAQKYAEGTVETSFRADRFIARVTMPIFTVQGPRIIPPPPAGITIVQQKLLAPFTGFGNPAPPNPYVASFDAGIAAGSIIVFAGYTNRISYTAQTAGGQNYTDSNLPGNVNGIVFDGNTMGSFIGAIFAPAAGQTTVNFTLDADGNGQVIMYEVAGYSSPAWDGINSANGTSTTASSGATAALSQTDEFVLGVATAQDDVFTGMGAGGFSDDGGKNSGFFNQKFGHLIVSVNSAVTFAPTINSASLFRSSVATIKG